MGKFDDPVALRKERVAAFNGAIRKDVEPTRIPTYSNGHTWWIYDAGYKLTECVFDYTKMFDAVCRFAEIYQFDSYTAVGARNAATYMCKAAGLLDNQIYDLDREEGLNVTDSEKMSSDEYAARIEKGAAKFAFENVLPRLFKTKEAAIEGIAKAARVAAETNIYSAKILDRLYNHYGVPDQVSGVFVPPFEEVMNMRGIKGMSLDLRRKSDELDDFCHKAYEQLGGGINFVLSQYNPDRDVCFTNWTYGLAHTFLSGKQFERFYVPYFNELVDVTVKNDWTAMFLMEGSVKPEEDYFRDMPEGHFSLYLENDDIREFKKNVPNLTPLGGLGRTNLGLGTPEQCIDEAKGLIDDVGYDGKYIMSTASIMSWPIDAKGENLKAVMDFVREYGKMKK